MILIDVTCAIIMDKQNILACMRGENSEHANMWEFPGGKLEENETAEECIVRELKEELGIGVKVLKSLKSVYHTYSNKQIHLIPFICEIVEGEPKALEHSIVLWQHISEFDALNWTAADRELFYLNKNEIECWHY